MFAYEFTVFGRNVLIKLPDRSLGTGSDTYNGLFEYFYYPKHGIFNGWYRVRIASLYVFIS